MRYELIREIFNKCSGNQMRDVFVSDVTTDDPYEYVGELLKGKEVVLEREDLPDGTVIINADVSGLMQRFSFTPDD